MKRTDQKLTELHSAFVAKRSEQSRASCSDMDRRNGRHVVRLAARGVTTIPELIAALPELPWKLKDFAIWWLSVLKTRAAEAVLLKMLHDDPPVRLSCAHALAFLGGRRSVREFIRIGKAQLASPSPDREWLEAVIRGFRCAPTPEAEEMLLSIYERTDLPGWVRGDAGDTLGICSQLSDRRTRFFRRALTTALNGLDDAAIEVQFYSMYILMQLAQNDYIKHKRSNACFAAALPRLREIARKDNRLAPGLWWPMSAEAEDAIHQIKTGNGLEKDAGERWLGNPERGPMIRD